MFLKYLLASPSLLPLCQALSWWLLRRQEDLANDHPSQQAAPYLYNWYICSEIVNCTAALCLIVKLVAMPHCFKTCTTTGGALQDALTLLSKNNETCPHFYILFRNVLAVLNTQQGFHSHDICQQNSKGHKSIHRDFALQTTCALLIQSSI